MFSKDLKTEVIVASLVATQALTTTNTGTGLDLQSYAGNGMVVLNAGTGTGTTPTMDVKIQDSADNSSFADVSGYTFTQVTTTPGIQTLAVDTRLVRRYIRTICTIAGTTPSFPMGIVYVGYKQVV